MERWLTAARNSFLFFRMFGLTAHWAQLLSSRGAKYGLVFLYRVIEAVCVIYR